MLKVVGASWMQIRMSTWIIGAVLVVGIVVVILGQMGQSIEDGNYSATAYWNKETGFEIRFWGQGMDIDQIPPGVARVHFQPHTDTTGWAIIDIMTQPDYPDWVQAYAAGMLEGSLSWQLIYWHWKNTIQNTCESREAFCNYIRKYLEENFKSVQKNYQTTDDPYWYQIYLFYVQIEGLQQGFEHGVKRSRQSIEELKFVDFLWMNAANDIVDLEYKFFDTKPYTTSQNQSHVKNLISDSLLLKKIRNFRSVNSFPTENHNLENDESRPHIGCGVTLGSSFVKIVPEEGQLFVAHNSAGLYVSMLKMIKHYHFKYHWSATNFWMLENKLTFSSHPGAIHSADDFYILSSGSKHNLIISGTPITVFSKDLWKHVSPYYQVLSGPRAVIASRLCKTPSRWAETFSKYNSGTGNKEWMIINAEKFINISKLRKTDPEKYKIELRQANNILWIAEQIPGYFIKEDQTAILLSETYWASYGLPFYENITELTEVNKIHEQFGDAFSYDSSPLARIYRRDHENATTLSTVMKLMRSNLYQKDPYSMGNPRCAIGARGDIPSKFSFSFPIGVTDSKVFLIGEKPFVSKNITLRIEDELEPKEEEEDAEIMNVFQVIAGPAYSMSNSAKSDEAKEDRIEPFDWSKSKFVGFPHNGHPDIWDFAPVTIP